MRLPLSSLLLLLLASFQMRSAAQEGAVQLRINTSRLELQWFTGSIVRVRISPAGRFSDRPSLSVIASSQSVDLQTKSERGTLTIGSDQFHVSIDTATGALKFFNAGDTLLLSADGPDSSSFVPSSDAGDRFYHIRQSFRVSESEGLYGLGQFEDPVVNERGRDILIAQANRTAVNPFLVSTRGYGILWDNSSKSRFTDDKNGTCLWSEAADEIVYYFVYGPTMDEVIAGYRTLTGKAPLFGKWAYGYWQSKERYKSSSELISVLREYRTRNIPLDNIVQDWAYWGDMDHFSGMIWDSAAYPDPRGMADSIHNLHGHLMVSIWPAFGKKTAIYQEMLSKNLLYPVPHWNNGRVYDAFNPLARQIYWSFVKKGLYDVGVDAFWMDATEPEFRCSDDRYITELSMKEAGSNFLGSFARYLNAYSLMTTRAVFENQRRETTAKRAFILTRSSFAGQQRFGAVTWSGDTFASWDDLRVQVAAGISFSMSGIPYWTNDIGGFITDFHFPRGLSDPAYKELYVRWFQFGAFCPIFRAHGTNIPREVWQFGKKGDWAYDALVSSDRLRYRLLPYLYSVAWKVTHDDYSFLRGLPMAFPDDTLVYDIADQYLFGPSLMICPVTRPMSYGPGYRGIDITPDHFYSPSGEEHGMDLEIYRGADFDSLLLRRKTDASQVGWTGCLPEGLSGAYSLRISGRLVSDVAGMRMLFVNTDGGVRLWFDNRLVLDHWNDSIRTVYSAAVEFKQGVKHPFRLEHRQFRPNTARLKINWEMPGAVPDGGHSIEVYLPGTTTWFDFWTGVSTPGGKRIHVDAPIDRIPMFVPAGSILPFGPEIQYATEPSEAPTELRIYPGRDADFAIYDDEGDGYNYEQGAYTIIPLHWDDSRQSLTIGNREGNFPGASPRRVFSIVLVREHHGAGSETTAHPDARIVYTGEEVKVRL